MNQQTRKLAVEHLRAVDPKLGKVIRAVGPVTLRLERDRFAMLVKAIISQQLSTGAARSIRRRLDEAMPSGKPTPHDLLKLSRQRLCSFGLSKGKAAYLHGLADHVARGNVRLERIGRLSDEAAIEHLTQVKGIGRWTAEMFLIFSLGRPDVLPVDDLGVRSAIRNLYGLKELPNRQECLAIGAPWKPFASIASWYCWRSLDLKREAASYAKGYPT